jgi:hypothetical protein
MAHLIMEKLYGEPFLSWGSSNLVNVNDKRKEYIAASKLADKRQIQPLISFAKS